MHLFIQTPGTYLHVWEGLFEIRRKLNGQVEKRQFAAHKVKGILLSKGTALSTDAVALATQHQVDLLFLEPGGHPYGRVWQSKLGSTTRIRKRQLEASLSPLAVDTIKAWLTQKLDHQADFLASLLKHRPKLKEELGAAISRIGEMSHQIQTNSSINIEGAGPSFRGWEGSAGKAYFEALSLAIPDRWRFHGRSSRPAHDPFNACLNYAYGILYGQVEKALITAGLDPYVGFMHRDDYNHKSMVYDFIEPYRIFAEKVVFQLFSRKKVNQAMFEQIPRGVSLGPEGKPTLVEAYFHHTLEEKVYYKGRRLTRMHMMQTDAHRFANQLLGQEKPEEKVPELSWLEL
ncbi:MAG: CRISPR-associated endonuclease Cas1 [Bacteroidota bacterium]